MRRSNQEIERHYFNMFRTDYPLPDGMIDHGDKPDFILEAERKIGIEMTQFFLDKGELPESEQVQSKARNAVVSQAQRIYQAEGGKGIELSFGFDKEQPIRDQRELAKKIAEVARTIDEWETGAISKEMFKNMPEVSSIFLNAREYEDAKWRLVQVHSVPLMSMEKLGEIVRIKEAKA